jgi:hypothetical protein
VLPSPEATPEKPRVTIEAACRAYIANGDAAGVKPPTLRKYHSFAKQIRHFVDGDSFEETPTSHRLLHTFARILLQKGVPVADVADLLGNDEKTVRDSAALRSVIGTRAWTRR